MRRFTAIILTAGLATGLLAGCGGELQRFCLARALRPGVRFLLCDEITAMLDLVTRARIWNCLMEEAKKRGLGLLVVSHDEKLLGKVCTRVVEL